jgi:hypothetical protein
MIYALAQRKGLALVQRIGPNLIRRNLTMNRENEQSYIESEEEREKGHESTRCPDCCANHDPNLGCDMGIDVAG